MTAPTIHTASTGSDSGNTTSTPITLDPANFSDGDTIVILVTSDAANDTLTASGNSGAFTAVPNTPLQVSGSTATLGAFYKRNIVKANETFDSVNYDFTVTGTVSERRSWICFAITGDGGTINAQGTNTTANSATQTIPAITTTVNDCLIIGAIGADASGGSPTPMTPTSYTKHAEVTGTSAGSIAAFYLAKTSAGAQGADTVTMNVTEQGAGISFAIQPVASGVSAADAASLSDSPTITVSTPASNVTDSVALTDAPVMALASQPKPSDAITLTETVSLTGVNNLAVSEAVTLAEAVTLDNSRLPNVSDSIALTDTKTVTIVSLVNGSDTATLTETVALVTAVLVNVSDAITVGEQKTLSIPGVTPTQVVAADAAVLAESISVATAALAVNTSSAVAIAEAVTLAVTSFISKSDTVTSAEAVTLRPTISFTATDSVTLAEAVTLANVLGFSVSDALAHTESIQTTGQLFLTTSQTITVTESRTVTTTLPDQRASASDALGTGELVRLFICVTRAKTTKFIRGH